MSVAQAAPNMPKRGISTRFTPTLIGAALPEMIGAQMVFLQCKIGVETTM
ncbi:MAG: hypothetical protein ABR941_05995 [Thermoleophilia bacterium]|jgi:hypothetical protein